MRPKRIESPTRHNGNVVPIYKSAATPGLISRPPMLNSVRPCRIPPTSSLLMSDRLKTASGTGARLLRPMAGLGSGADRHARSGKALARYPHSIHELLRTMRSGR